MYFSNQPVAMIFLKLGDFVLKKMYSQKNVDKKNTVMAILK